jgi:anthranilate synthase/aminodeoxychorismate synthase-like glutamine amidotransferase
MKPVFQSGDRKTAGQTPDSGRMPGSPEYRPGIRWQGGPCRNNHARQTSEIYHNNTDIFAGLENPFTATRYHSLVIDKESLPDCLEITAWTQNEAGEIEEIMGVRHKTLPIYGVQFHPESILTAYGHDLLQNFLDLH